jgi:tetratricopeptide (TPR) repeat protein
VLEKWLAAHPQVHLAVMTSEFAKPFIQLSPHRYHFTPFGSLADYLRFLRGLDIGLAPLLPTGYNRCRSDVKFLEYASQGVAGIYTDLEPYRGDVVPEQTGLLYRTEAELLQALDRLAGDAELRLRIRRQAHAHVAQHRRLEKHIGQRLAFYRELLKESPRGQEVPAEVLALSVREERYLQLRRQPPEDTLVAAVKGPTSKDTVAALKGLVEKQPTYLSALQHLGRQLNDLRDFAGALSYLEQARPLNPQSARTLCEIGRSLYQLNQDQKARQTLEAGLTLNPYFQLGWQYLLRLLQVTRSPDGWRWAERARQMLPANFALALLGARLYPPQDAIRLIHQLLDTHAPTFFLEEIPGAAAAFSETIRDLAGPYLGTPQVLDLLRRACEVFPTSAFLATMFGRSLHEAGRYPEARAQCAHALALRRVALTYRAEFPKEDGTIHFWQFAEHIRSVTKE